MGGRVLVGVMIINGLTVFMGATLYNPVERVLCLFDTNVEGR